MTERPWRLYPKGTARDEANWPIEVREAWSREERLAERLRIETGKNARLRSQVRAATPRKPKLPAWRKRSGRPA